MLQLAKEVLEKIKTITPSQVEEAEKTLRSPGDDDGKPQGTLSPELQKFFVLLKLLKEQIRTVHEEKKEPLRKQKIKMENFFYLSVKEQFGLEDQAVVDILGGWVVHYYPPYCEECYTYHSPREKCPPHIHHEPIITERGKMGGGG